MKKLALSSAILVVLCAAPALAGDAALAARRGEILKAVDATIGRGPFAPTWESLESYQVPAWYQDGKFGIFIHWGVYSRAGLRQRVVPAQHVPAGHAPSSSTTSRPTARRRSSATRTSSRMFKAEKFDPARWADAVQAGRGEVRRARGRAPRRLRHVRLRALATGRAAKMGPKRDIIGELAAGGRASRAWSSASPATAPSTGGSSTAACSSTPTCRTRATPASTARRAARRRPRPGEPPTQAFLDDWLARTCELVDKYQPQLVWFDWWIEQPAFEPYLQQLRRLLLQPRRGVGQGRGDQLQERGLPGRHGGLRHRARPARRHPARSSGRPTPPSPRTPGATSTNQDYKTRRLASSTTWWTS